jgi:hypothetical protein
LDDLALGKGSRASSACTTIAHRREARVNQDRPACSFLGDSPKDAARSTHRRKTVSTLPRNSRVVGTGRHAIEPATVTPPGQTYQHPPNCRFFLALFRRLSSSISNLLARLGLRRISPPFDAVGNMTNRLGQRPAFRRPVVQICRFARLWRYERLVAIGGHRVLKIAQRVGEGARPAPAAPKPLAPLSAFFWGRFI